ncbi:MAG: Do family serine endopeptidase [Planctomycetota bacterium]
MRTLRSQVHWMIALVVGFGAVAVAVSVAQRPAIPELATARDAHELSSVFRQVANKALPSVVTIETRQKSREIAQDVPDPFEDFFGSDPRFREFFRRQMPRRMPEREGMGSGFIVDPSGIIVTNNHVVADADEIIVRLNDGREFRGEEVKRDERTDIAILKINTGEHLSALRFGNSDETQVGDWVVAVGNPFGHELTVTSGIISAKGRGPGIAEREDFLQTDAAINPGNSGGPLLNLDGDVIGVNTAISSRSGGFDGIGFAVPGRMAWWVAKQLIEKGEVQRAYIGISIQPIDPGLARQFGLNVGEGAIVTQVLEESPGESAKLQTGDVVLSLAGKAVTGPRSLQGIVEQLVVDQPYKLEVLRDGERISLSIVPKQMPQDYSLANVMRRNGGRERAKPDDAVTVDSYGFQVRELTPEIAEQLGLDQEEGVVVSSVDSDGAAARALRVGDVIEKVGNQRVTSVEEFNAALKESDPNKGLLLLVRTSGATRFVVIQSNK